MSTLTVSVQPALKSQAQARAKKDGVTLTFLITQILKAYRDGKLQFSLSMPDDDITASFDISTPEGKAEALEDFKALCT